VIDLIRKAQHRVSKARSVSAVDVELDVQVDGSATAVLGMQVDFPAWRSEYVSTK